MKLRVTISRENINFTTTIFRKSTFSRVYTNFQSFLPLRYKTNILTCLLFRAFSICSDIKLFHLEVTKLKEIFRQNGYPKSFIDMCVQTYFLDNIRKTKDVVYTVPKKELSIVLPYLGINSLRLKDKLENTFKKSLPFCKILVIFRTTSRIKSLLSYKDRVNIGLKSHVIYKFMCSECNLTYYGKTPRHFIVRYSEHLSISPFTGKKLNRKTQLKSNVEQHIDCTKHCNDKDSFSIISSANSDLQLKIQESILIKKDQPILNAMQTSILLVLF